MRIVRFTKTPTEHPTAVLYNDEDSFEFAVSRTEDGRLQVSAEDYRHTFKIALTKKEEAGLLTKLQFV